MRCPHTERHLKGKSSCIKSARWTRSKTISTTYQITIDQKANGHFTSLKQPNMAQKFQAIHYNKSIPDLTNKFEIICPPDTDVWEKPPSTHSFNAPIIYTTISKGSFQSARVTVSGLWKHRYDQGGMAMIFNAADRRRWVKTGIEFYQSKPYVSSVATDQWSDWSLRPTLNDSETATIEMAPADGALWIYLVDTDGSKVPMREVTWWAALPDDTEIWIGPYAAKPAKESEELVVQFQDLKIVG